MSYSDDLVLLALLILLVEEDKRTEQIEDSKRSRIWSYQWLQDRNNIYNIYYVYYYQTIHFILINIE